MKSSNLPPRLSAVKQPVGNRPITQALNRTGSGGAVLPDMPTIGTGDKPAHETMQENLQLGNGMPVVTGAGEGLVFDDPPKGDWLDGYV
jgi:hypothetical protein